MSTNLKAEHPTEPRNVVLIEGLSASGKTSACKELATVTSGAHVPSGLYFCSLVVRLEGRIGKLPDFDQLRSLVEGIAPLPEELASESVRAQASQIAAIPMLWEEVMRKVRSDVARRAESTGLVFVDGRGLSEIWPEEVGARVFLTASAVTRKRRMLRRWQSEVGDRHFDFVQTQTQRDKRDSTRPIGATRPFKDSLILNTDLLDVVSVANAVLQHLKDTQPNLADAWVPRSRLGGQT